MLNNTLKYLIFAAFMWLIPQCSRKNANTDVVVARVGENKLMLSELKKITTSDLSDSDSAIIADDYIKKWVKQELLIQKANENLTPEQKNVTKELFEYRNSLIIYKYKNELMKQRMDTVVTKQQIEEYYNEHPENFNLVTHIVKAIYLKIPLEVANPEKLKQMAENTSEEGLAELREYCLQYARGFDIYLDQWVNFEIIMKNLPPDLGDAKKLITAKKPIEAKDLNYYYLVNIQDYRLKNSLAPEEFVANNIRSLILNQRKIKFLKDIENNVYREGIRKNKFTIHNLDK